MKFLTRTRYRIGSQAAPQLKNGCVGLDDCFSLPGYHRSLYCTVLYYWSDQCTYVPVLQYAQTTYDLKYVVNNMLFLEQVLSRGWNPQLQNLLTAEKFDTIIRFPIVLSLWRQTNPEAIDHYGRRNRQPIKPYYNNSNHCHTYDGEKQRRRPSE